MKFDVIEGKLYIPEGEEYITEETYHGLDDLEEVFLPSSMKVIGPVAFCECNNLKTVHLNEGLEEIGDGAFLGSLNLSEIVFPISLVTIGAMSFWNSAISKVIVPENVETIGESAFWDCCNLEYADVLGENTIIDDNAFGNCPKLVRGYIAPGFPTNIDSPSRLLYSILWLTNYDKKYSEDTIDIAKRYISENQELVLEHILKTKNAYALNGIVKQSLIDRNNIEKAFSESTKLGYTEIISILLNAKNNNTISNEIDEFKL